MTDKPILVLDFDGVLHSYKSGWKGADIILDPPVPGAQQFCHDAQGVFELHIVSSRCNQPGGVNAILTWLAEWGFPTGIFVSLDGSKPAAFLTLDDRAMTFEGLWPSIERLRQFVPWAKLYPQGDSATDRNVLLVEVIGCARCGENHSGLLFRRLGRPIELSASDSCTHWATCPTTGEPILLSQVAKSSE